MTHSGRCYCGKINYEFEEPIYTQILCHCRECRYISGGEANASIVISENNFRVTKGTLKTYAREDLEKPTPPEPPIDEIVPIDLNAVDLEEPSQPKNDIIDLGIEELSF